MNKYLEKIAKEVNKKKTSYVPEAVTSGLGASVISKQYHDGNLTGRETFYHGTSKETAEKIKKEGIVPGGSKGIVDEFEKFRPGFKNKNEGLSFMTKTKVQAHAYAGQAEDIKNGKFSMWNKDKRGIKTMFTSAPLDSLGIKKDKGVIKFDVPTWKKELQENRVVNPEVHISMSNAEKKEYAQNTFTHKGTIPPKFARGSEHYEKNTISEIKDFIKHDPKRFTKGVILSGLGATAIGLAARSALKKRKQK